jgi:hypothetical protein
MSPYYYVINRKNAFISGTFMTLARAQQEAEELAYRNPGCSYDIVRSVGVAHAQPAATFWMDGEGPEPISDEPDPLDP